MSGSIRNRQVVKIAGVVGLVLVAVYLFLSWKADVRSQTEKLDRSKRDYNELLSKFNKLTDELKENVKLKAEKKLELDQVTDRYKKQLLKLEGQLITADEQAQKQKADLQAAEDERDKLERENEQYEVDRQSSESTIDNLNDELDSFKTKVSQCTGQQKQCQDDLEGLRSELLSAQTSIMTNGKRVKDLETQFSVAEEAFQECQKRIDSLQADSMSKQAELQQLRMEAQKQPPQNNPPSYNGQDTGGMNIVDSQKEKFMADLRDKMLKGIPLSDQEQHAFLAMNRNIEDLNVDPVVNVPKRKVSIETGATAANQQPAPPGPEGEEVEDLVGEKNRKDEENLDNKQDEGGADGVDEEDGQEYRGEFVDHDNPQGQDYEMEQEREGDQPLPDPVREEKQDVIDFPNIDEMDAEEVLRRDREVMENDWHGRIQLDNSQKRIETR